MSKLELHDIRKTFGSLEVIHGVSLNVTDGEFMVFVGPSGCGKSTMLRMIAGLEEISSGKLLIDNVVMNEAEPIDRGVSMVFQSYALYPNMTVQQNLAFALEQAKLPKDEIRQKVRTIAETLKITDLLHRRPNQLSGGQSQRVAIGRAIVRDPRIFLFDEPLSNLDAELRVHMRVEIGRLHKRLGRTMVFVTHDQVEAMTLADRIAVFNEGRIEQVGTPLELYNEPENLFVAGFIGSPKMNFLSATVKRTGEQLLFEAESGSGQLPTQLSLGNADQLVIGVRAEHVSINTDTGGLAASVLLSEQLGSETLFHCSVAGQDLPWTLRKAGQIFIQTGSQVNLRIDWNCVHFFDAQSGAALSRNST